MILPQEYIKDSVESYFYRKKVPVHGIYISVLLLLCAALTALPFIYIDISVSGYGYIRPEGETTNITSPMTSLVEKVYVHEGDVISKGDTILIFRTNAVGYQQRQDSLLIEDCRRHIKDLEVLSRAERPEQFHSPAREKEYLTYQQRIKEMKVQIEQLEKEYKRYRTLYKRGYISSSEYEKHYYAYTSSKENLSTLRNNQLASWQSDLNDYINRVYEYGTQLRLQTESKIQYVLRSPVDGNLETFRGIHAGSLLTAGQQIATISPSGLLYAECYIQPKDIGYIERGQKVGLQVTAFNYNEWGMLHGEVENISSDIQADNTGRCYFLVRCKLDDTQLTYKKTGRIGKVTKGMEVSSHFLVARRSLFDLLYQNMDEWMNPTQSIISQDE